MPCCILRVDADNFSPDEFLRGCKFVADTTYRAGETRRGTTSTTSGFTILVSDDDTAHDAQVRNALQFLGAHRDALVRLRALGVRAVLDFGCEFPGAKVLGRSYRLPLALLSDCAALGIEVELSVYLTQ